MSVNRPKDYFPKLIRLRLNSDMKFKAQAKCQFCGMRSICDNLLNRWENFCAPALDRLRKNGWNVSLCYAGITNRYVRENCVLLGATI